MASSDKLTFSTSSIGPVRPKRKHKKRKKVHFSPQPEPLPEEGSPLFEPIESPSPISTYVENESEALSDMETVRYKIEILDLR